MTKENNQYLIIINPRSGKCATLALNKIKTYLSEKNIAYDVYYTKKDFLETEAEVKAKLSNVTDVVVMGGDGTLNLICHILADTQIALGIVPCGTGNDFVRNIYQKTDDIISVVTGDNNKKVDLGFCHERYFINVLGVGYDAMIAEKTKDNKILFFRSLSYLLNGLKYLFVYQDADIKLNSNNFNKNEKTFMAVFGNGQYFGSGMNITPKANIEDGLLDCCWIGQLSLMKKINTLIQLYSGTHLSNKNIEYHQGKEFHIETKGLPIQADGEFIGYTPTTVSIKEKALLLKVP